MGKGEAIAKFAEGEAKKGAKSELNRYVCHQAAIACWQAGKATTTEPGSFQQDALMRFLAGTPTIPDPGGMKTVPRGAFIGFLSGGIVGHAMISTGKGKAAGSNNGCLGRFGGTWCVINLADELAWSGGRVQGASKTYELKYKTAP